MTRPSPRPWWATRALQVCAWPTRVPGATVTWWCGLPFCHDGPHLLVDSKGRIRAKADSFTQ